MSSNPITTTRIRSALGDLRSAVTFLSVLLRVRVPIRTLGLTALSMLTLATPALAADEIPEPKEQLYAVDMTGAGDIQVFEVDRDDSRSGQFAVEVSYTADALPDGRYRDGRVACELRASTPAFGTSQCELPVNRNGALDRRGRARWHVVRLSCAEGQICASERERLLEVRGIIGPRKLAFAPRPLISKASSVERSPARAGGYGFPASTRLLATCRDGRFLNQPLDRLERVRHAQCSATVTVSSAKAITLFDAPARRYVLGRQNMRLFGGAPEEIFVFLDGGKRPEKGGVRFTLAFERLLRRRRSLSVVLETWSAVAGLRVRRTLVLRAPRAPRAPCRTGCRS